MCSTASSDQIPFFSGNFPSLPNRRLYFSDTDIKLFGKELFPKLITYSFSYAQSFIKYKQSYGVNFYELSSSTLSNIPVSNVNLYSSNPVEDLFSEGSSQPSMKLLS